MTSKSNFLRHVPCEACGSSTPKGAAREGWKEAAIAWSVCESIHREYARGKDPFYSTRRNDFIKHYKDALKNYEDLPE